MKTKQISKQKDGPSQTGLNNRGDLLASPLEEWKVEFRVGVTQ